MVSSGGLKAETVKISTSLWFVPLHTWQINVALQTPCMFLCNFRDKERCVVTCVVLWRDPHLHLDHEERLPGSPEGKPEHWVDALVAEREVVEGPEEVGLGAKGLG